MDAKCVEVDKMEVKQWKVFENLDPVFTDDIRMAFVLGKCVNTGFPTVSLSMKYI